jgi:hypothetical protein
MSEDEIAAVIGRMRELNEALEGLVNRLDEIAADPEFKSVWTLHHVHGGDYRGPTWVDALAKARAALN